MSRPKERLGRGQGLGSNLAPGRRRDGVSTSANVAWTWTAAPPSAAARPRHRMRRPAATPRFPPEPGHPERAARRLRCGAKAAKEINRRGLAPLEGGTARLHDGGQRPREVLDEETAPRVAERNTDPPDQAKGAAARHRLTAPEQGSRERQGEDSVGRARAHHVKIAPPVRLGALGREHVLKRPALDERLPRDLVERPALRSIAPGAGAGDPVQPIRPAPMERSRELPAGQPDCLVLTEGALETGLKKRMVHELAHQPAGHASEGGAAQEGLHPGGHRRGLLGAQPRLLHEPGGHPPGVKRPGSVSALDHGQPRGADRGRAAPTLPQDLACPGTPVPRKNELPGHIRLPKLHQRTLHHPPDLGGIHVGRAPLPIAGEREPDDVHHLIHEGRISRPGRHARALDALTEASLFEGLHRSREPSGGLTECSRRTAPNRRRSHGDRGRRVHALGAKQPLFHGHPMLRSGPVASLGLRLGIRGTGGLPIP